MSLWIPARELDITWVNDSRYWKWTPLPPPNEKEEVAELLEVCWLNIVGKVELKKLLVKTSYCAYLVFKLKESSYGLDRATARVKFAGGARNLDGREEVCSTTVSISEKERPGAGGGVRFPQARWNGWMQIKLGESFFNDVYGHGVVEASLFETERLNWKSGLIVKGIEFLPTFGVTAVVSPYLRSKLSSILQEAVADPNSPPHIVSRFRSIEMHINSMSPTTIPVDLLYDFIDALSDCRVFAHQHHPKPSPSNKVFFGRVISEFFSKKKIEKIGKQLDAIETKLQNIPPLPPPGDHARLLVTQQTYPLLDSSRIIGFESYADTIEGLMLLEENISLNSGIITTAIGIVGRCGSGKTALAQKVFASPVIQAEFSPRIWVCLSVMMFLDDINYRTRVRVLSYILNQMGYDVSEDPDCDAIELREKLRQGLMGKRYLIVLDDAWRFDEFYADLMYTGGTLIVTSRSENVIRRAVGDNNNNHVNMIRMEPHLSHEICREIFDNVVREKGIIDVDHPTLEKIKDDLLRNYDGLPLAVTSLAGIISELLDQNIGVLPTISEEESE